MLGAFCLSLGVMCYHSQYVRLTFKKSNRIEGKEGGKEGENKRKGGT